MSKRKAASNDGQSCQAIQILAESAGEYKIEWEPTWERKRDGTIGLGLLEGWNEVVQSGKVRRMNIKGRGTVIEKIIPTHQSEEHSSSDSSATSNKDPKGKGSAKDHRLPSNPINEDHPGTSIMDAPSSDLPRSIPPNVTTVINLFTTILQIAMDEKPWLPGHISEGSYNFADPQSEQLAEEFKLRTAEEWIEAAYQIVRKLKNKKPLDVIEERLPYASIHLTYTPEVPIESIINGKEKQKQLQLACLARQMVYHPLASIENAYDQATSFFNRYSDLGEEPDKYIEIFKKLVNTVASAPHLVTPGTMALLPTLLMMDIDDFMAAMKISHGYRIDEELIERWIGDSLDSISKELKMSSSSARSNFAVLKFYVQQTLWGTMLPGHTRTGSGETNVMAV
ncbi:hypothetical protein AOQ84DRAFT_383873 [Glonium stellatum]|uniref:Uncharacterized protein n=1 Tax=Glonium stellatum TaxID=574774 RepID=A0A8E2EMC4_9PEZI|nr:hypothetical protein AOQ84DRAFT_383873 [Glonium stellatum]